MMKERACKLKRKENNLKMKQFENLKMKNTLNKHNKGNKNDEENHKGTRALRITKNLLCAA